MKFEEAEPFYTDDFMFNVMGITELPAALYQYTSIDALEKITSSRSLRFSRLDTVNDPEEATASDIPFAASSVFVSCWSNTEEEQIPMWSMYGQSFCGVRLRMPANMFSGRERPKVLEKGGASLVMDSWYTITRKSPAFITNGRSILGPNKVYYSDDPIYRNRRLVYRQGEKAFFSPHDLGLVKGTHWSYEQEWRFKIAALQFETSFPDSEYFNKVALDFVEYPVEALALYIPLDPSALDELEVTIGPRADSAAIKAVERILSDHAPKAEIVRSKVRIR